MKMFGFFQKKIEKTDDAIKTNNKDASTVRKTNSNFIEIAKNSIDIMRKAKKAKKIENREAVALKFGAFRRNVINLFKYDNEKISDQDMRKSIIEKYDAKRVKAGIAKYDKNGKVDMDKTVEWTAENNSRKELNSGIIDEKKAIWGHRVDLIKNEIKHTHIDNKLQSRKDIFKALGIVTSPLKYATDGIVQGAKAVNKTVLRPARAIIKTKAHSYATSSKKYKAGDGLAKNCVRAFREKASTKAKSVGDSIRATAKSAQVSFNKLKANYAKKQASKYAHMFREAQAKTQ